MMMMMMMMMMMTRDHQGRVRAAQLVLYLATWPCWLKGPRRWILTCCRFSFRVCSCIWRRLSFFVRLH